MRTLRRWRMFNAQSEEENHPEKGCEEKDSQEKKGDCEKEDVCTQESCEEKDGSQEENCSQESCRSEENSPAQEDDQKSCQAHIQACALCRENEIRKALQTLHGWSFEALLSSQVSEWQRR